MKDILKKYNYEIPNKYKSNQNTNIEYTFIDLFDQKWKIADLEYIFEKININENDIEIINKHTYESKETKSSLAIEGVIKKGNKNYDSFVKYLEAAKEYLNNIDGNLTKQDLNKIYSIASNNEKLIAEGNEKLKGNSLFRQDKIFVGGSEVPYKGKVLEKYVDEYLDKIINASGTDSLLYAFYAHFFFEHIHPFPDYNGRIGRMILSWYLSRTLNNNNLSNYINNNISAYYKSIELTEQFNDLTFTIIFFAEAIVTNNMFMAMYMDDNGKYYKEYNNLSEGEQQALFNLFTKRKQFAWKEYQEYFKDTRTKQQIHNILRKLEELKLIKSETYKNGLKRYYYE